MIAGFLGNLVLMYLHVIPCNSIANGRINGRKSPCEKEFNANLTSITTVPVTTWNFPCCYRHLLPPNAFPYHSSFTYIPLFHAFPFVKNRIVLGNKLRQLIR